MSKFNKDSFSEEPMDQNLYFAHNLPRRKPLNQSAMVQPAPQKTGKEFKSFFLLVRWLVLMMAYPFFFLFRTAPAFIGKWLTRLSKKCESYYNQCKAYLYQKIGMPVIRFKQKVERRLTPPLQAGKQKIENFFNLLARVMSAQSNKMKELIIEVRQLFKNSG